jgi:hypothetical protein
MNKSLQAARGFYSSFIVPRSSLFFRVLSGGSGNLAESLSGLPLLRLPFDGGARAVYIAGVGRGRLSARLLLRQLAVPFFLFCHDACSSGFVRDACVNKTSPRSRTTRGNARA